MSIGIKHTRGETPGQEGRQDTHGTAQASRADDRGSIDFCAPIAERSVLSPISGRYQADIDRDRADVRPISTDMHGAFIADTRAQIGLRSEIPVIGPIWESGATHIKVLG